MNDKAIELTARLEAMSGMEIPRAITLFFTGGEANETLAKEIVNRHREDPIIDLIKNDDGSITYKTEGGVTGLFSANEVQMNLAMYAQQGRALLDIAREGTKGPTGKTPQQKAKWMAIVRSGMDDLFGGSENPDHKKIKYANDLANDMEEYSQGKSSDKVLRGFQILA